MIYDYIIVGAGSAGCPLAARLSEDSSKSILLLEAGPHYRTLEDYPAELQHANSVASSTPGHPNNWSFMGKVSAKVSYPIPRGKVVGGSSALNGAVFNRGTPEDYDGWAELGNSEWSFAKVLPYFCKLESDRDFHDSYHGDAGPIPVRRSRPEEWPADQHAFVEACRGAGYRFDPDKNAPLSEGVGPLPMNSVDGMRINAALAYLSPHLDRPNLTVRGDSFVRRVLFDGLKAVGVECERDGVTERIHAREVILSSGAIKSPHLLMLSGIGPGAELRAAGVPLVRDAPAVGKSMMDHPTVVLHYSTATAIPADPSLPQVQNSLHYTASGSSARTGMEILPFCVNTFGESISGGADAEGVSGLPVFLRHPIRTLMALRGISLGRLASQFKHRNDRMLCCILQQPDGRGEIVLRSADPHVQPDLNYRYFENAADRAYMREAVRIAVALVESRPFERLGARMTTPEPRHLASDKALDAWLVENVVTAVHMAGTCRMGPETDPDAVVDQYCRVIGVEGLRVVDASIQPTAVRRGANATAVMIGERAADLIKATRRAAQLVSV